MVVHLVRFERNERASWGVLNGDLISPLSGTYPRTADLIERGQADWTTAAGGAGDLTMAEVSLLSPITTPCRVMCQGVNYREHAIESGMDPDARTFNLFFDKTDASVAGPDDPITRPAHVKLLDYEIEMALALRKKVAAPITVNTANLHEYVFGVTIANDVSARDVQLPQGQFLKGKSYRGFCPLGPVLAVLEPQEMNLLDELDLRLEVNGAVRQRDNTANMLYKPAETLTELSEFCNLDPGDVLLTGTPHGITAGSPPQLIRRVATALLPEDKLWAAFVKLNKRKAYLKPGDVVTSSIRHAGGSLDLGTQRNTIVAPPSSVNGVKR